MSSILPLWLPTVVASVAVFLASFVIHMVVKWHQHDQKALPNEGAVADAMRGTPPGEYRMPFASSMQEMRTPAFHEKMKRDPIAIIGIAPYTPDLGFKKALGLWFVYILVISWLSSHIAWGPLHDATPHHGIIVHTVGLAAWLGYGFGHAHQSIWGPKPWVQTIKNMVDGLVYALITGGIFAWLWPR